MDVAMDLEQSDLDQLVLDLRTALTTAKGCLEIMTRRRDRLSLEQQEHMLEAALTAVNQLTERTQWLDQQPYPLAGLASERSYRERLRREVSKSARYGQPLSLLVLAADQLLSSNGNGGPHVDAVMLEEIATVVKKGRNCDDHFHVAPGEFAVIMPNTSREGAEHVAERILREIEESAHREMRWGVAESYSPDPLILHDEAEANMMERG
jgi:diguanylate cyclase (GGDEF)-like protein